MTSYKNFVWTNMTTEQDGPGRAYFRTVSLFRSSPLLSVLSKEAIESLSGFILSDRCLTENDTRNFVSVEESAIRAKVAEALSVSPVGVILSLPVLGHIEDLAVYAVIPEGRRNPAEW